VDIEDWLRGVGLPQYIELFRSNDIDGELLRRLTADDLKELGIASFGHRKRLLEAVTALSGATPVPAPRPAQPGERRQLTVMFCDLVGSTALAERLDPEDLRDVMRRYQDTCAGIVARYEGVVARFMGDGVLAYFGFPMAHEDDAERAVRASLEMTATVAAQQAGGAPLAVRVGVATGLVIAGEIDGLGDALSVVGGTPNLAARLQTEAPTGGVVLAPSTRRLAGDWFSYRDLGLRTLKGIPEPVAVTQVLGERAAESRFAAIRAARLTPFVGRDQEIGLLVERWRMALDGQGQMVLLSGEAGMGKSRIAEAFRQRIDTPGVQALRLQCSPHHTTSALRPAISLLQAAAGIEPGDAAQDKLAKLQRIIEPSAVPLLADLLAIPPEGRETPAPDLTPALRKAHTLRALVDQFLALARDHPLLVMVEDAHWIDPSTLELLDLLIASIADARLLLLITARPEFQSPWSERTHTTIITLHRFGQRHCSELIDAMTGGAGVTPEMAGIIATRADGVPLFVEELTKSVLESGSQSAEAIPATLHDLLLARLDRLAAAKEVAQIGAAIGREFSYRLIASVANLSPPMLGEALRQLEAAGLVFRGGEPPEANYRFKHALVQDAAHGSLLRSRRHELHGRIAQAIESHHPELADNQPELLAQHYAEAGLAEQSARYWLAAGRLATSRSSTQEALAHFTHGLETLAQLAAGASRDSLELDLQIGLASATIADKGYAADETETAYGRAIELLEAMPEDPRQIAARYGLFVVRWNRGQLSSAASLAQEMLKRANESNDAAALCVSHRSLAVAYNPLARFALARNHALAAVEHFDPVAHRGLASQYGHDIGVAALSHVMTAASFLGDRRQAENAMVRALSLTEQLSHPNTAAYAQGWAVFRLLVERDMKRAQAIGEAMVTHAEKYRLPFWLALGGCYLGSALVETEPVDALRLIRAGRAAREASFARLFDAMIFCFEAEALLAVYRPQEARAALDRSNEHARRTSELWWLPELHRIRAAAIHHEGGERALVRAELMRAAELAQAQGSETFRRRAMVELKATGG
jgi:predicted ATPase/class 3 adenylate cyclase